MLIQLLMSHISQSSISKDVDEIELIVYGMKIIATTILTSIFIILIGIILGQPLSAIIYLT